jgi:peptidoglycan hydrolase-like protein with peptidoglycan-binding domain
MLVITEEWIALKKGSKGEMVKKLQQILNDNFGYDLLLDGDFGEETETAVKQSESQLSLAVDGYVTQKDFNYMKNQKPLETSDIPKKMKPKNLKVVSSFSKSRV